MQNYKQILKETLPQLRKDFTLLQKILTVLRHLHLLGKCQGYELPTSIRLGMSHAYGAPVDKQAMKELLALAAFVA